MLFSFVTFPNLAICRSDLRDKIQEGEEHLSSQKLQLQKTLSPTPTNPKLFPGLDYDLSRCARDVALSDMNEDGFISRDEEYLSLINRIGILFCFQQRGPLVGLQNESYFHTVCALNQSCRPESEIPIQDLTADELILICTSVRRGIFIDCLNVDDTSSSSTPTATPSPTVGALTLTNLSPELRGVCFSHPN